MYLIFNPLYVLVFWLMLIYVLNYIVVNVYNHQVINDMNLDG